MQPNQAFDQQIELLHSVLNALSGKIIVVDALEKVMYINPSLSEALQADGDSLIGKKLSELIANKHLLTPHKGHADKALHHLTFTKADGSVLSVEMSRSTLEVGKASYRLYQEIQDRNATIAGEEYHEAVLATIPDLLYVVNDNRSVVGYHAAFENFSNTTTEELIGKKFHEFLPVAAAKIIDEALDEADSQGTSFGKIYSIEKETDPLWFELSVRKNESLREHQFTVLARNITTSKNNEIALARSEIRFRSIIEQSNEGIVLCADDGRIVLWNRSQSDISGLSLAQVEGKFIWDVMFDLGTPQWQNQPGNREQLKQRILNILSKKDDRYIGQPMESEIIRNDGERRMISTTLFPVEYSDHYLLGAIYHDITDLKKSELTLIENQEYIRTLCYDSPVPVLVIEESNRLVFDLNKAALAAFGCQHRSDLVGKSIEELLPPQNEDDLYFNRQQILEKLQLLSDTNDKTFDCHFRSFSGDLWDAKVHTFRLSMYEKDLVQLTLIDTTAHNKAMQALFESESRYRAVAENANAGIVIVDLEERIVYCNETLARMLGSNKEQLIGSLFSAFVPEETYRLMAEKTFQRFNGSIDQYEADFFYKDGSLNTFSISASPLFSSARELIGTVGVMIDITQQKRAATKLIETSDRLQAILASMPDMIFIHDKEGKYLDVYINQKLFPNETYQPKKGQYLKDIFDEVQANHILSAIHQCLRQHETVVISFDLTVGNQVNHFEGRLSPMGDEKVVSVVRDTTTLVTLESELIFNNELMRMLTMLATRFINLPLSEIEVEINKALAEIGSFAGVDRVYIFDYDWENDCMNNTFEWCSEKTPPAIAELQKVPNEIFPDWVTAHRQGLMTHVPSVSKLPEGDALREILEPQGIQSLITLPFMEANNCLGYVGFDAVKSERAFTDSELSLLRIFAELLTNLKIRQNTDELLIQNKETLQKQNEQLLDLNNLLRHQNEEIIAKNIELDIQKERAMASDRLKTAFLNNVSHEVRTPLNGIVGFAQFLSDDSLTPDDKKDFVSALNISVSRLTDTINDIMDVSLLMSGNMIVHPEKVNLKAIMEEVYRKNLFEAKTKNLELQMLTNELPAGSVIISDIGMLSKITNELVGNAIKYTQKGFVRFGFELQEHEIVLRVSDSGIGISTEAKNKIFEPFMQADNSSTRQYEGSGLGLTIVKGLTELLKGSIALESSAENGTSFTINLPCTDMSGPKTIVNKMIKSDKAPTILIAEDELLNVLYIKRILSNSGYNILYAQNGEEAVRMVKEHPSINLVLMDIKMPVMDGLEATRQIRLFDQQLPIIAVTAYAANDDRHDCIAAGCTDYLSKPFTADDLTILIKKQYK